MMLTPRTYPAHAKCPLVQRIRRSLATQGILKQTSNITLQSWRKGTKETICLVLYIKRLIKYCHRKHVSFVNPSIFQALHFLVELFDQGIGYSAMNTA